jgi:hypothetical protein
MDGRRTSRSCRCDGRPDAVPGPATEASLSSIASARTGAALGLALVAGLGLAWLDTRAGFDDTGLLVGLIVVAGVGSVVIGGGASWGRAALMGVLVGAPTPILDIAGGGQAASIVALLFALTATLVTSFVLRVMGRDGNG